MRLIRPARPLLGILAASVLFGVTAKARLGEDEAQSRARYGDPNPELIGKQEAPLLVGCKELAYNHEGWRIRVGLLNGRTVRIEYAKLPDASGFKKLTPAEVDSVLEAEKGTYRWREDKPRTGVAGLNALKTALEGRQWERSDHALARLKFEIVLVLETRDADAYEKKLEKAGGKPSTPPASIPKF